MKSKLVTLTLFLVAVQYAAGQQMSISGKIVEKDLSTPIEYAHITLLKTDSTYIKGVTSDSKGDFLINNATPDNYLLSVAFLGYETASIQVSGTETDKKLGNIVLEPKTTTLNEAVVTAQSITAFCRKISLFSTLLSAIIGIIRPTLIPTAEVCSKHRTILFRWPLPTIAPKEQTRRHWICITN